VVGATVTPSLSLRKAADHTCERHGCIRATRGYDRRLRENEAMQPMTRRQFIGTTGLAAAAPLGLTTAAIAAQSPPPGLGTLSVEKNIVFGKGGSTDLHLDIYRPPAGAEKRMATIHLHGGGFTGGSKDSLVER